MEIFPVGLAVFAIFLIAQARSLLTGLTVAMATVPLGALAAFSLGSFNFLVFHLSFMSLILVMTVKHLVSPNAHLIPKLEKTSVIFLVLTLYAIVTSQIFPRLFANDIWVFSLGSDVVGQRVSPLFLSQISLLKPSSGNISQPIYLALSAAVFIMAVRLARTRGLKSLDTPIFFAAGASAITGFLDFANIDVILSSFKTAGYVIFIDARIVGASRIVGAFSEASTMGTFCASMFAYMMVRYLGSGNRWALILAVTNLLWTMLALSSTGYVALCAAGFFIFWRSGVRMFGQKVNAHNGARFLFISILIIGLGTILSLLTNLDTVFWTYFDELIFQKGSSISALERGAWTQRGIAIGFETFGMGAGLGSTISSGLIAVCFSNIGIIGVLLYAYFVWSSLKVTKTQHQLGSDLMYFNAASVALLTLLCAKLVSTTTVNPGVTFMMFAAMAVASRSPQYFRIESHKTKTA